MWGSYRQIVIVSPVEPDAWSDIISAFNDVFWIKGTVREAHDLRTANVKKASAVVLLADRNRLLETKGDEGDADTMFQFLKLEKLMPPHVFFTVELFFESNLSILNSSVVKTALKRIKEVETVEERVLKRKQTTSSPAQIFYGLDDNNTSGVISRTATKHPHRHRPRQVSATNLLHHHQQLRPSEITQKDNNDISFRSVHESSSRIHVAKRLSSTGQGIIEHIEKTGSRVRVAFDDITKSFSPMRSRNDPPQSSRHDDFDDYSNNNNRNSNSNSNIINTSGRSFDESYLTQDSVHSSIKAKSTNSSNLDSKFKGSGGVMIKRHQKLWDENVYHRRDEKGEPLSASIFSVFAGHHLLPVYASGRAFVPTTVDTLLCNVSIQEQYI